MVFKERRLYNENLGQAGDERRTPEAEREIFCKSGT